MLLVIFVLKFLISYWIFHQIIKTKLQPAEERKNQGTNGTYSRAHYCPIPWCEKTWRQGNEPQSRCCSRYYYPSLRVWFQESKEVTYCRRSVSCNSSTSTKHFKMDPSKQEFMSWRRNSIILSKSCLSLDGSKLSSHRMHSCLVLITISALSCLIY